MSKFNQKGDIRLLVIPVIAAILIGFLIWTWVSDNRYQRVFQAWTGECYKLGGSIQISGSSLADCFVNNQPCQIDGFQQYSTLNPDPRFNSLPICKGKS